ncbi:MAG: hypothetical protein PHE83_17235 [Opitutaceae bacterium]|nr:hypothetical protein [Opitutaceae bacterium]
MNSLKTIDGCHLIIPRRAGAGGPFDQKMYYPQDPKQLPPGLAGTV